jgi:hypothetical protein
MERGRDQAQTGGGMEVARSAPLLPGNSCTFTGPPRGREGGHSKRIGGIPPLPAVKMKSLKEGVMVHACSPSYLGS